jgi:hypothetical protein
VIPEATTFAGAARRRSPPASHESRQGHTSAKPLQSHEFPCPLVHSPPPGRKLDKPFKPAVVREQWTVAGPVRPPAASHSSLDPALRSFP